MNPKSQDAYTQAYNRWVTDQTPDNLAALVSEFMPTVNSELQQYQGPKELLRPRAKSFVIRAIKSYNPLGPTKLNSWVVTNLKQLSRYGKRLRPIRESEDMLRNVAELKKVSADLEDALGRKPTDEELQDETGWSKRTLDKIRSSDITAVFSGKAETLDASGETNDPAVSKLDSMPFLQDAVYLSLGDRDKVIFDSKLGRHGKDTLAGGAVAKKLGVTPAYVSQRAANMSALLARLGAR